MTNLPNRIPHIKRDLIQTVDTLAELTALVPEDGDTVYVRGRTADNDGFEGVFCFDSARTAADENDGTLIADDANDGLWVRAYDGPLNVKWFGAVGDGSTPDHTAIQAALDAADADTVIVRPSTGSYKITTGLSVPAGVTLHIERDAVIETTSDINVIEIKPQGFVTGGGKVFLNNGAATKACLYLEGGLTTNKFNRNEKVAGASNLLLACAALGYGIGIHLTVSADTDGDRSIQWTKFNAINISAVQYGIKIDANEDSGDNHGFVNGNSFQQIGINSFQYGIHITATGTAISEAQGNSFIGFQYQAGTNTDRCILENQTGSGRIWYNRYIDHMVYDWNTSDETTAVETNGYYANFIGLEGVDIDEIILTPGQLSPIVLSRQIPFILPRKNDADLTSGENEFEGSICFVGDKTCLAFNREDEWQYIGNTRVVAKTATYAIEKETLGVMYTNEGDDNFIIFNLPVAENGMEVQFKKVANQTFKIDPDGTDIIYDPTRDLIFSAGEQIWLIDVGAWVHLKSYKDNEWTIVEKYGKITEQDTTPYGSLTVVNTESPYAVTADQRGYRFDNYGTAGSVFFDLPAATIGLEYTFYQEDNWYIQLDPLSGENFAGSAANVNKKLNTTNGGAFIYVKCFIPGVWHVMAAYGVITDEE